MARSARVVAPGLPHHVTQRGNRRQRTFFCRHDYRLYLRLVSFWCRRYEVAIWGYCLMPNHVHLILVPAQAPALAGALAQAHRRYTLLVNRRQGWQGYLWQGRFHSCALDEDHLRHVARYVLLNPVRAGLVARPEDWPHSSARATLAGSRDRFADVAPLRLLCGDPATWAEPDDATVRRIQRHARTGRPLGSRDFRKRIEEAKGDTSLFRSRQRAQSAPAVGAKK